MSKRKTHEKYVAEVAIKNPNIEVVGVYIDAKTKILHRCKIDGCEWYAKPNNILNGKGCPKCCGNIKKTHEEYVEELSLISPHIVVLEEYINANTPILHLCKKHNVKWDISPSNTLQGNGCCECGYEKISEKNGKTHKQFVEELKRVNPFIVVLGTYVNSKIPILFKCLIDEHEWMGIPSNILSGQGCPKCAGNIKKTHNEYVEELSERNPNIEVLGEYINANTPILHRCKKHFVEWNITPYDVLHGKGCYKCGNEKIGDKFRKSQEQYTDEVRMVNPDIIVVGSYINLTTPILHKCKIDDYEWYATPDNILYGGCGCPQCKESSGERLVRQWLNSNNIDYEFQKRFVDCRHEKVLPFDFYLPQYNVCIEYQGGQHYFVVEHFGGESKFQLQQKHDNIKREYCKNNNIRLLEIPYFENVEEMLNNFLFI